MIDFDSIQKVTVLGQGVMGPDIALCFALAGYEVTGVDILNNALESSEKKTSFNCELMTDEDFLSEQDSVNVQARITRTLEWEDAVVNADFIIEAVPEILEVKQRVFSKCDEICSKDTIVASNTSSMDINQISAHMEKPERAITTHFTIPAHLSPMVEMICGEKTWDWAKNLTCELLKAIGKHPVFCKNSPGFIHNYLQFALFNAALELLEEQVASPEDIDSVVRNGFGLRLASVGPVQFLDMCGLDTVINVLSYLQESTKDPKYEPPIIIREKVAKGALGVKSGNGFYCYEMPGSNDFWEKTNRGIIRTLKSFKDRNEVLSKKS